MLQNCVMKFNLEPIACANMIGGYNKKATQRWLFSLRGFISNLVASPLLHQLGYVQLGFLLQEECIFHCAMELR